MEANNEFGIVTTARLSPELEQRFKDQPELLERFRLELAYEIWRRCLADAERQFMTGEPDGGEDGR